MFRSALLVTALALVALSCSDSNRSYPECPPGADPSRYDCVPTQIGGGGDTGIGADTDDDVGTNPRLDTGITPGDTGTPEDVPIGCVPRCEGRECGNDGCGGVCGTCGRGEACAAGVCVERGGGGDGSCRDIVECIQGCEDDACWQQCISIGSPPAQDLFRNAVECVQVECAEFQDDPQRFEECQTSRCGDILSECYEVPIGGGDLSCEESFDCIIECTFDGDDECQNDCYFSATTQAQRQLEVLFDCAEGRCDDVDTVERWAECASERCPRQFGACFDVEPPPPGEGCSERDMQQFDAMGEETPYILTECGYSCIDSRDAENCARDCTTGTLGLSAGCGVCTGRLSLCIADQCPDPCGDPLSEECDTCIERRCAEDFYDCSGLPG